MNLGRASFAIHTGPVSLPVWCPRNKQPIWFGRLGDINLFPMIWRALFKLLSLIATQRLCRLKFGDAVVVKSKEQPQRGCGCSGFGESVELIQRHYWAADDLPAASQKA